MKYYYKKDKNTSYDNGMWDCAASGHVDENESIKMALSREAKEELNIDIKIDDIEFASYIHKYISEEKDSYNNFFFVVKKYNGAPIINEPNKCSEIKWFDINNLPDNFLSDRKIALKNYFSNIYYDEICWDNI